jgi:Flp pilus assembly protein TadD
MPSLRLGRSGYWRILVCVALLWAGTSPARAASRDALRLNEEGVALTTKGQYEEAASRFTEALRLNPGEEIIRRNLARVRTVLGHQYLQSGALSRAQEQFETALDLVPSDPAALLGLGDVQLRNREPRMAEQTYRRVMWLTPPNPDLSLRLGEAYYQQGDLAAALSEWERGLALQPDHPHLRKRMQDVQGEARIQSGYQSRAGRHFTVTYDGQRREEIGRAVLQILEDAYRDVGYELNQYPLGEVQVILYSRHDFQAVTGSPHWVLGEYDGFDGKIRLPMGSLDPRSAELKWILYHEYTHALIYDITKGNILRWLNEGLARYAEKAPAKRHRDWEVARAAARQGALFPLRTLSGKLSRLSSAEEARLAYAQAFAATEYLLDSAGVGSVQRLLRELGKGRDFSAAFQETFGMTLEEFEVRWHVSLARRY